MVVHAAGWDRWLRTGASKVGADSMSDAQSAKAAEMFGDMQRKVIENAENGFRRRRGDLRTDGNPVEWMMVNREADPALFWGTVQTQVNIRMQQLNQDLSRNSRVGAVVSPDLADGACKMSRPLMIDLFAGLEDGLREVLPKALT